MVTFLTEEDFKKVPVGQFTPAYFDEKNLTTDWLEEELADDGRTCSSDIFDKEFICYMSGIPCIVSWCANWLMIRPFKGNGLAVRNRVSNVLLSDFSDSEYNVFLVHTEDSIKVYFYFKNED